MARFCEHCGAALGEASVCPSCGAVANKSAETQRPGLADQAFNLWQNTPDTSADFAPDDIRRSRWIAALAYLNLLVLAPLLLRRESPFVRFHINQGVVLLIFQIISLLMGLIPYIGTFVAPVLLLISLVMCAYGIVNALRGRARELPFIGRYRVMK